MWQKNAKKPVEKHEKFNIKNMLTKKCIKISEKTWNLTFLGYLESAKKCYFWWISEFSRVIQGGKK